MNTDVSFVQAWFADQAPGVVLSITRVEGFLDLISEQDHFSFEEVLYRWIIETETQPDERFVCLSGGFKTMSFLVVSFMTEISLFGSQSCH